jgi:23S rRNA (uracil1939-C5)-methyltransferase
MIQQVKQKQIQITEVFSRWQQPLPLINPMIPSTQAWGYRTSTKLTLSEDRFGRKVIGLYQRHSKTTADIPSCPVHHPLINRALEALFGRNKEYAPAPFYDERSKKFQPGKLKFITLRLSPDYKSLSALVSHTGVPRELLESWAAQIDLTGTSLYEGRLTPESGSLVIPHRTKFLAGEETMAYGLPHLGLTFPLTPSVFFQANGPMTETLIKVVCDAVTGAKRDDGPSSRELSLLDLYGGFGAFSFALKDRFKHIWVVEANKAAINAALAYQKTDPSSTHVSPNHQTVESFFADHRHPPHLQKKTVLHAVTHCILNPPRSGLGETVISLVMDQLPNLKRLVYVSCNPDSMVKDLKQILKLKTLSIESVQPIDMFPQTEHLETVVTLVRD